MSERTEEDRQKDGYGESYGERDYQPHYDLRTIPDDKFRAEASRRDRETRERLHKEQVEEARRQRERADAKDAEFAAKVGITFEQYMQVEEYVRDKVYEELD